jgi:hypothetical protein
VFTGTIALSASVHHLYLLGVMLEGVMKMKAEEKDDIFRNLKQYKYELTMWCIQYSPLS